jgi:predicted anti-sigma-YlaC factor YlaD
MKCEEIQSVLVEYLTRELGAARAALVREHLRRCPNCRRSAGEIKATLELLRTAAKAETGLPERLTEERRARIRWAFMHPVLDWIYRFHVLVSVIVAAAALVFLLRAARRMEAWNPPLAPGVTVTIDNGPPGDGASNAPPRAESREEGEPHAPTP